MLEFHSLRLESLAPLSAAPALTRFHFKSCKGLGGETINVREMIPAMTLVTELCIRDQLSAADAETSTVALLQRLPRLTRDQFAQIRTIEKHGESGSENDE